MGSDSFEEVTSPSRQLLIIFFTSKQLPAAYKKATANRSLSLKNWKNF
jgi:hypothetical protein